MTAENPTLVKNCGEICSVVIPDRRRDSAFCAPCEASDSSKNPLFVVSRGTDGMGQVLCCEVGCDHNKSILIPAVVDVAGVLSLNE